MMSDVTQSVRSVVKSVWWLTLLRGILAIVIGIVAIAAPAGFAVTLAVFVGVYLVLDGATFIYYAVRGRRVDSFWMWALAIGLLDMVAGVIVLLSPGLFAAVSTWLFLWLLALAALVGGVVGTVALIAESPKRQDWGWLLVGNVLSVVFGILMIVVLVGNPVGTLAAFFWVVGVYAIILGVFLIVTALVVRKHVTEALSDLSVAP